MNRHEERNTRLGERIFWAIVAVGFVVFLAYFIGAYRFAEPARQQMRRERSRYFGSGLNGL